MTRFQVLAFWLLGVVTGACAHYVLAGMPVLAAEHRPFQFVLKKAAEVDGQPGWVVTPMLPTDLEAVQVGSARTLQKWDVLTCVAAVRKVGEMAGPDGKPVNVTQAALECGDGVVLQVRHVLIAQ